MSESQATPSNIDFSEVSPYTPSDALVQLYTSKKKSSAWKLFGGTLLLMAIVVAAILLFVSIFHVIIYSIKIIIAFLFVMLLPIYSIYNLISTYSNLSKKNYSFYTGVIARKADNGYLVRGISASGLSFLDKADADAEKAPGAPVIIAKMKDDFDLLGMQ